MGAALILADGQTDGRAVEIQALFATTLASLKTILMYEVCPENIQPF